MAIFPGILHTGLFWSTWWHVIKWLRFVDPIPFYHLVCYDHTFSQIFIIKKARKNRFIEFLLNTCLIILSVLLLIKIWVRPTLPFWRFLMVKKREGGIWKMNKSNLIDWKIKAKLNNFFETIFNSCVHLVSCTTHSIREYVWR